jgi:hypothetical protein
VTPFVAGTSMPGEVAEIALPGVSATGVIVLV